MKRNAVGVWILGFLVLGAACSSDPNEESAGRPWPDNPGGPGNSSPDGGVTSDGGVTPNPADAGQESGDASSLSLQLSVDITDGQCADLSLTDRGTYAMQFQAEGTPGTTLELWVDKPACNVEPFVYEEIELDENGQGTAELDHPGSTSCSENLLGGWRAWLQEGTAKSNTVDAVFSNATCAEAESCQIATGFCPPDEPSGPLIPPGELFVLSAEERDLFTPPPGWLEWGMAFEDFPLRNLWEAFDAGVAVVPLDPNAGPSGWFKPDGTGSQNHSLLWLGVAALGYALAGDVAQFEVSAANCLQVLSLDDLQGHMRHEAVGLYAGFWEGGIATMALAGLYAPEGSTSGPDLLAAARSWWADHIAVLRRLSHSDGQVSLIGARIPGVAGDTDSWSSLSAAVNLQLIDPRPHADLHPTIAALITADGRPAAGTGGVPVVWHRPRHVAERWVVLRAVQSGALPSVPKSHPAPDMVQSIYRWTAGGRTYTAVPAITGFRPARWQVSWQAGSVLRVEIGDPNSTPHTGKGPHLPPTPLNIPSGADLLLGSGS